MRDLLSSRLGSLLRGSLLTTAASAAINFAAGIALARLCGPTVLGQFVLLVAAAHLAFAILAPGFDQAYIQKPDAAGRWPAVVSLTALQGLLLLTLPLGLLVMLSAIGPDWMPAVDLGTFAWLMVGIVLTLAGNLLLAPLAVALAYRQVNLVRLLATAAAATISVTWAASQPSPSMAPLIARELCSGGVLLLGALVSTRLPPSTGRADAAAFVATLRFSSGLWGLNVLEKCVQRLEYLVLGLVATTTDIGVYFAIRSIFDGFYGVLSVPIQTVLFAYLCRDDRRGRLAEALSAPRTRRLLMPVFIVIATVGALSTPVFAWLLGARFAVPWSLTSAFAMLAAGLILFELTKIALMSLGQHRALLPARLVHLLLLVVLVPTLGHLAGLSGAAAAATLATAGLVATAMMQANRLRSAKG